MNITGLKQEEVVYRVYDISGKLKRLIKKSKERNISSDEWLKGVSCFIINANGEILIEKRVNEGLTPGKQDLCSGHIDGNEVPTQAMIRELQEELGIDWQESANNLISISKDTPCPLKFDSLGEKRNFLIYFYCLKKKKFNIDIQKDEIESISWIPMEECFELIRKGKTKFPNEYCYEDVFKKVREIYKGVKEQARAQE